MHPASLCTCKVLEQGQATHQQQYCSESRTLWKWCGLRKKQLHFLSFRSQLYRRGICLLPAATQQIPRATLPRFGMTILGGQTTPLRTVSRVLRVLWKSSTITSAASGRTLTRPQKLPTTISSPPISYQYTST